MKNDVALIRQILNGDETAFAELMKKYQKQVHVLAWRKIGDFHIAEDITQDAFLKVYQRLHTLKDPNQFPGWLYVVTRNLCNTWLSKNRFQTQPLEDIETNRIDRDIYSQHIAEERVKTAVEAQREVVKKLLAKLKESERTVMTLHYLGEMTVEEISKFLGVSAGTIKSRLQRARNRLKKEETVIREALEYFKLTPNLTENIMREIERIKPLTPTGGKPLVPWVVAASSAIILLLMLGLGSQNLVRFQQPYSLEAQVEMTVELVDTPIVLNIDTEPDVRNQQGNSNALGISENNSQKPDDVLFAAAEAQGENVTVPKQQWIQSEPIKGTAAESLHITQEGDLYILDWDFGLHKLSADGKEWQHIIELTSFVNEFYPTTRITKWNNTLYILPSKQLFASKDDGKTWNSVQVSQVECAPVNMIGTENTLYVALSNCIYHTKDNGKTWQEVHDGLRGNAIHFLVKLKDTLFAGTDNGLYRLGINNWERIEFPESSIGGVFSVTATEDKLYVAAEFNWEMAEKSNHRVKPTDRGWWIFRSTDLGESWTDITPKDVWSLSIDGPIPQLTLVAVGETILAIGQVMVRSNDAGDTWLSPQRSVTSSSIITICRANAVNENIIYISSDDGLHRSIDKGSSWNLVNIPHTKEINRIDTIIAFKGNDKRENKESTIYAKVTSPFGYRSGEIAKTTDKGRSWKTMQMEMPETDRHKNGQPNISQLVKSNDVIYAKGIGSGGFKINLYTISVDGNKLVPIQDAPIPDGTILKMHHTYLMYEPMPKEYNERVEENTFGAAQFFKQLAQLDAQYEQKSIARTMKSRLFELGSQGQFAVSGNTFYMEYNFKLFRWMQGDTQWFDTGLEETVELIQDIAMKHLKLAVSGNTVYVGKRDGHLVVSYDKGDNWVDLTPALPFRVKIFNDIVVTGSTVYVATDGGIITSDDGRQWNTITNVEGTNIIMAHLAIDGKVLYGITENTGAYRLENGIWKQVVSEIPDRASSLAVDGNTLFVGTENNKIYHFNLQE